MPFSDASRVPFSTIAINVAGGNVAPYAVFAETNFTLVSGAQPGDGTITLRDPKNELSFKAGSQVQCVIDGELSWSGFAMIIEQGFFSEDSAGSAPSSTKKWVLHCVDYNILLDRTYIYNHAHPTQLPEGGPSRRFPGGVMPYGTTDGEAIIYGLQDTDLASLPQASIDCVSMIQSTGVVVVPVADKTIDARGRVMQAGSTSRALLIRTAASVNPTLPGSMVFYIDVNGFLVYAPQDEGAAAFDVTDDPTGSEVGMRDAMLTSADISHIKNDVLLFTTEVNRDPNSQQSTFLFRHNQKNAPPDDSVGTYGRWQYAEIVAGYLQAALQARSVDILFREGTPGQRAEFTVFRPGLLPNRILTVNATKLGLSLRLPIRQVEITFPTQNQAAFRVTCSFDTQDPWGLLTALKRPPQAGMVPPRHQTVHLLPGGVVPAVDPQTFVEEQPRAAGSLRYQCAYGYVRYSLAVYVDGRRLISTDNAIPGDVTFKEIDPPTGKFQLGKAAASTVYVSYAVSNLLAT
jgi:hypothetical protein